MLQSGKDIILKYQPNFPLRYCGSLHQDTTEFMNISYGDVISLGGFHYMVLRDEAERRFGLEDPKYWVKRCQVLETGESKILKLVFHEQFPMMIGSFEVTCHRSPEKEARILELVRGDTRFMQGSSVYDTENNIVRILDIIRGKRLDLVVDAIDADHKTYFFEYFPAILEQFIGSCSAIKFLHDHFEKHGDIRRDHLWVESKTGNYRWIDFDYAFAFKENPFGLDLLGLGNILCFLVGKGVITKQSLYEQQANPLLLESLSPDDFSLMFPSRLVNLMKRFPYIPESLNHVLMHFSSGALVFYETVGEMLMDLEPCLDDIQKQRRVS